MKNAWLALLFLVCRSSPLYAAQSTLVDVEGKACTGDDKSRRQTEQAAMADAKKCGQWDKAYTNKKRDRVPGVLKQALMQAPAAWKKFQTLSNSLRNQYVGWVRDAKTEATRLRRVTEVVARMRGGAKDA